MATRLPLTAKCNRLCEVVTTLTWVYFYTDRCILQQCFTLHLPAAPTGETAYEEGHLPPKIPEEKKET